MKGVNIMTFEEACKQKINEVEKIAKQSYGYPISDNNERTLNIRKELELQLKNIWKFHNLFSLKGGNLNVNLWFWKI